MDASATPHPSSQIAQAPRFLPGTVIAKRYRIVAQIGRGGMGEVYRADDLRLGQTVALKFVSESLTRDPGTVTRLTREVRTARQVSHPNVCRVFDIGEAEGVPFITMEFIDGEDLASLLPRIGRLQPSKALQLAHQLCAGLAEIHAYGILHRDLKPANVMLDGRGNLRITDFGLAVMEQEIPCDETSAGTPAYMAPEQLAGSHPTQHSDIYALGLILFELFTGKPAFENLRMRGSSTPKPSAIANDVDPVVERAILHCLKNDPDARPRTANLVASSLPGGDPLAAALAAGETPSPDAVAAAVDEPAICLRAAWILLAVVFLGIVVMLGLERFTSLEGLVPPEKSPDALIENAHQIARRLGYRATAADSVFFSVDWPDQIRYLAKHEDSRGWRRSLREIYPAPYQYCLRESPRPMQTLAGWVDGYNPAPTIPGSFLVGIDQRGRLQDLRVVPPDFEAAPPIPLEPDWSSIFDLAGLPMSDFTPTEPKWQPPMAFDRQRAWQGLYGGYPLEISAASFHGRIVFVTVVGPWNQPIGTTKPTLYERMAEYTATVFVFALLGGGLWLARKNWILGRGDHRGAFKFGFAIFVGALIAYCGTIHYGTGWFALVLFLTYFGLAFSEGLLTAAVYLAIEPLVRRRWPNYLVGWTRLLAGRFSNPRLGRDLLVGISAGTIYRVIAAIARALPNWVHMPAIEPISHHATLSIMSEYVTRLGDMMLSVTFLWSLGGLALLLFASVIFRSERVGFFTVWLVITLTLGPGYSPSYVVFSMIMSCVPLFVLARFGFLASTVCWMTAVFWGNAPLTADSSRWYFPRSCFALAIPLALAVYGFRTAVAGSPVISSSEESVPT